MISENDSSIKIKFELPEWAIGKHITIFANAELLGQMNHYIEKTPEGKKEYYLPLKIKPNTGRCSGCGECCLSGFSSNILAYIQKRLALYDPIKDRDEPCPFLERHGCGLGNFIPFNCVKSYCNHFEGCTERLE